MDKYFLCFGFENFAAADLKPFHVTAIYFGVLDPKEVEEVIKNTTDLVTSDDLWFIGRNPITFLYEEMFGMNKDIRVLLPHRPNPTVIALMNSVANLIEKVGKYRKHIDYPFNPHLTTDLVWFESKIDILYLCKNNYEVIAEWGI